MANPDDKKNGNGATAISPTPTTPRTVAERNGRGVLPDGYERVNSAAPVWLVKAPDVKLEGILVGRFMRKGDQSSRGAGSPYFYQFEVVNRPVIGTVGSKTEDTQETLTVEVGQIISVDESEALKDLEPFCDDGGKYQFCLVFGKKQTVKNTKRTFWPIEIGKKTIAPPTPMRSLDSRERRSS